MKLRALRLRNFKGVTTFDFEPDGEDAIVYGANAAGKTTLADAFHWLLFGKDSANRATFDIKTLDDEGKVRHGLDHTVEADLVTDTGEPIALAKTYKEVWTKKRGEAARTFTGHTTDHYIDKVPVKKGEYEARVASIADESIFRILTDPTYVATQLHWEERRHLILAVSGDVTQQEVIDSNPELADLPGMLETRSIEDHRKMLTARRRSVNQEIEQLPVRIDEAERSKPEAPSRSREDVQEYMKDLRTSREKEEADRAAAREGGGLGEATSRANALREERRQVERRLNANAEEAVATAQRAVRQATERVSEKATEVRTLTRQHEDATGTVGYLTERLEALRSEYVAVDARTLDHEDDETCPACGQPIPEAKRAQARAAAQEEFNARKAKDLADLRERGLAVRADLEKATAERDDLVQRIDAATKARDEEQDSLARLEQALREAQENVTDPSTDPEYGRLTTAIAETENEIDSIRSGTSMKASVHDEAIADINTQIATCERLLAAHDQIERTDKRIADLTAEERTLAETLERIENELYLLEAFTRAKVRLLEARVNQHFDLAHFRLFRELVGGGIEDSCDILVNGVPYDSLNHGSRLNAGIDIINTLARHYDFAPPVFIDNAESVTDILPTRGQAIKLVVSAADTALRIETSDHKEVAA